MHDSASIEEILGRLMPPALSDAGRASIEAMLDELAPGEVQAPARGETAGSRWKWLAAPAGVAAAVTIAFYFYGDAGVKAPGPLAMVAPAAELTVVGETGRIDRVSDAGLLSDPDGGALHGIRMRVVEENTLRDEETGLLIRVTEPRDELLLVPVSAF